MRTSILTIGAIAMALATFLPTASAEGEDANAAVCKDTGVVPTANVGVFFCDEGNGPCTGVFFDEGNGYYDSDDETLGYCPGPDNK